MKNLIHKTIIQKLFILILLTVLSFSFIAPNVSMAATQIDLTVEKEDAKGMGTLFTPLKKLLKVLGDGVMSVLQSIIKKDLGGVIKYVEMAGGQPSGDMWDDVGDNTIGYPAYLLLTPEAIFKDQIGILRADFINEIDTSDTIEAHINGGTNPYENSIKTLRKTIAKWYVGIRNFALVGLLSVLIYVGIRIIISSASTEKAKYKQMISGWVTAICLIFVLHYIMAFTFTITSELTKLFNSAGNKSAISTSNILVSNEKAEFKFKDSNETNALRTELSNWKEVDSSAILQGDTIVGVANLMQFARLFANLNATVGLTYTIIYLFLVGYTVLFFFKYTARLIRIAFLTLIAPLITLTYPIDKINDGQAQAFGMWLKEFVYNVLIQPFHLLIYTVFITSAIEFANKNIIYTLVVLGFMAQAEKLLRKMFGFEKASTMGSFSGAAAGSMIAQGAQKLAGRIGNGKGGNSGKGGEKSGSGDGNDNIHFHPNDGLDGIENDTNPNELPEHNNEQQNNNNNNEEQQSLPEHNQQNEQQEDNNQEENEQLPEYNNEQQNNNNEEQQPLPEHNQQNEQQEDNNQEEENEQLPDHNNEQENNDEQEENNEQQQQQQNNEQQQQNNDRRAQRNQRFKNSLRALAKRDYNKFSNKTGYVRGAGKLKNLKNMAPKVGRSLARGAGRYFLAGGGAILAGSAALLSGDPKAIASAVTIGAGAGNKAGKALGNRVSDRLGGHIETAKKGWYGNDYTKIQQEKENQQWLTNNDVHDTYRAEFGDDYQNAMQEALDVRNKYGVTDDKDIIKALKMTEPETWVHQPKEQRPRQVQQQLDYNKRIPAMSKKVDDSVFDDYDKFEMQKRKYTETFRQKGMANPEREAQKAMEKIAKFKGKQIPVRTQLPQGNENNNGGNNHNTENNNRERNGDRSRGRNRDRNTDRNNNGPDNGPDNGGENA